MAPAWPGRRTAARPAWGALAAGCLPVPGAHPAPAIAAVDRAYMDPSVPPCRDFYDYANGAFNRVPIPADYSAFGVAQEIDGRNHTILKDILESAARSPGPPGSVTQRAGDFYASGMDEATIEREGLRPIAPLLAAIQAAATPAALSRLVGRLQGQGVPAAFGFEIQQDDKDSAAMIAKLSQGGLGLPDRDYYFQAGEDSVRIRAAYRAHVARILELAGDAPAAARSEADAVMALETALARASRTLVALRDPESNYHRVARVDLGSVAAHVDWEGFLGATGFPAAEERLLVGQPEFFAALDRILTGEPAATWRLYLRWRLLDSVSVYVGRAFAEESFAFNGRVLEGETKMKPRWLRVMAAVDGAVGEDLGQLFVARAFSPAARQRVLEMVRFHIEAMHGRIDAASWMSPSSKQEAHRKLAAMRVKVGYPDTWRDYRGLDITRGPYVLNVLAGASFEFRRQMAKLGKPVDRAEWQMTPQTNDAYYDASLNEIALPAGGLQPPAFDERASDCDNYGALAPTIGHEITHGFDDQGRQYDSRGNLRNWWTDADARGYQERAERIARLYDGYEALPGLHINGHQTLGENIADVGGLRLSYEAYRLATRGRPQPDIGGFTAQQRFFLAFAQEWRSNDRPELVRLILASDVHSPERWRVRGPVANFPEFRRAFGCTEPTDTWPPIW
jgi:predicted metalloendopeptidase